MSDKSENFMYFVLGLFVVALTIFILVAIPLMIKDELATIKVKERLAEDGIVITNTQVEELLGEQKYE